MADEDVGIWMLKKQFEEVHETFRSVWQIYISFYTVFLTVNIVALAWLFGKDSPGFAGWTKWLVVCAFAFQCLLCALTSFMMHRFTVQCDSETRRLANALERPTAGAAAASGHPCGRVLPISLGVYGAWANLAGIVSVGVIWVLLALR